MPEETSAGEPAGREALSDGRLAEIRERYLTHGYYDRVIDELVTEVERQRFEIARGNQEIETLNAELEVEHRGAEEARAELDDATQRAETAERALAEMRERYDVMGQNRMEIAMELGAAGRWHPDNAAWTQDMHQAARIVEVGLDGYAAENGLPRIGGFIRDHGERKAADSIVVKVSDGEIQVPEDCPAPDDALGALNGLGYSVVKRKAAAEEVPPRLLCGCLGFCEGGPECLDDEGGPWPQGPADD